MRVKEIYSKLREFTIKATGLEDGKVIFANQSVLTRPKKPYVTVSASSFKNMGTPIDKTLDDSGKMQIMVSMIFTASFQAFSDCDHEAEELLNNLYVQFSTELQSDIFKGDMAKRRTLKHVSSVPLIRHQQKTSHAILEVEMGYLKSASHQVGLIESVKVEGLVNKKLEIKKEII
jgi:hypothetical protein